MVGTLLPAACFDMLTLAGLLVLGRRIGGRPLALAFMFAYLLYPFPALSLMAQTNDGLIAALCVWTIVVATERPVARGLLMAAAALTKFLPILLALQFLGVRRGRTRYALTLVAALAGMLAWPLITSGPARFLDSTFGYQLFQRGGGVQFSVWTYVQHLAMVARPVLAALLVLLALSPVVRPPCPARATTPPSPPHCSSARSYSWATGFTATSPGSTRCSSSRSSERGRGRKRYSCGPGKRESQPRPRCT
jgi:hypothetical protein